MLEFKIWQTSSESIIGGGTEANANPTKWRRSLSGNIAEDIALMVSELFPFKISEIMG